MNACARPGDERWMREALDAAARAGAAGEVPVGAIVVRDGVIVAVGANAMRRESDVMQHAEVRAMRDAMRALGTDRLIGCTVYVTLEPCSMCAGAIVLARVDRVVFAAWDPKAGMAGSVEDLLRHRQLNHRPEVAGGVLEAEAGAQLRAFFTTRRLGAEQGSSVDPMA